MCDVAYVILVEQLERRVLADRQAIFSASLFRGAEVDELPALHEEQARFDELLAAEPVAVQSADSEQHRLHVALGVA